MGVPGVRAPTIRDQEDQFQRAVRAAIKDLDSPGLRKVVVPNINLVAGLTVIPHQLGKIPVGWQVIDINAQATVWRDSTVALSNDTIALRSSAVAVATIQFW